MAVVFGWRGLAALRRPLLDSTGIGKGFVLQVEEHCNPSAPVSGMAAAPLSFDLPEKVMEACQKAPGPADAPHWAGQNWCWEWMKHIGCHLSSGQLSWREAQQAAAEKHLSPYPKVAPMLPLQNPDLCEHTSFGTGVSATRSEMKAAKTWFDATVAVYLLNVSGDPDQLRSATSRLWELGIAAEHIEGVNLKVPSEYWKARWAGWVPHHFNITHAEEIARTPFQAMGRVKEALSDAASRLRAMQMTASRNIAKPLVLILEDGAELAPDFVLKLKQLLETEVPCDWDVISLKSMCPHGKCVSPRLTRVLPDGNVPADRCRQGVNGGLWAMLYRRSTLNFVKTRLGKVVWDDARPHCLEVDVALASISDELAYYAVPFMQEPGFLSPRPTAVKLPERSSRMTSPPATATTAAGIPVVASTSTSSGFLVVASTSTSTAISTSTPVITTVTITWTSTTTTATSTTGTITSTTLTRTTSTHTTSTPTSTATSTTTSTSVTTSTITSTSTDELKGMFPAA